MTNSSANPPCGRTSDGKARRCPLRYNNFGFTVGGPIYFLKFGERDPGDSYFGKMAGTFFFFSEEQRRAKQYATFTPTVPDASLRQGIFPVDVCINPNNVAGATCTGSNVLTAGQKLPTNLINPAAAAYLSQIYSQLPLPSGPNFSLVSSLVSTVNFRQEMIKIDHHFTDKWSAFYKYQRDTIPTFDANSLFSSGSGLPNLSTTMTDSPGRAHTLQSTYVLSPNTIFEGRYTYAYGAILSHNVGLIATEYQHSHNASFREHSRIGTRTVIGNGFSNIQGFGPYDNFSDKHNWSGSLTMIRGSHTMKFGGNYSMYRKNENALVSDTTGPNQGSFLSFSTTLPANVGRGGTVASSGYLLGHGSESAALGQFPRGKCCELQAGGI